MVFTIEDRESSRITGRHEISIAVPQSRKTRMQVMSWQRCTVMESSRTDGQQAATYFEAASEASFALESKKP